MADMDILRPGAKKLSGAVDASAQQEVASYVLAVTEKGYGKRILIDEFKTQKRGGKGVTIIKFKTKAGGGNKALRESGLQGDGDALSCMRICSPGDEVVISTSKGTVMRQRIDDISIQSRSATGVLLQSIAKDDAIVTVDIVPPSTDSAQSSSSSVSSTDDDDGNDLTPASVVYQNNLVSSGNLVLL
jgi:DNA gyrase subunit A